MYVVIDAASWSCTWYILLPCIKWCRSIRSMWLCDAALLSVRADWTRYTNTVDRRIHVCVCTCVHSWLHTACIVQPWCKYQCWSGLHVLNAYSYVWFTILYIEVHTVQCVITLLCRCNQHWCCTVCNVLYNYCTISRMGCNCAHAVHRRPQCRPCTLRTKMFRWRQFSIKLWKSLFLLTKLWMYALSYVYS